jgi:ribonuclease HI
MGAKINFHIYADGSAFEGTNNYGIGWVRTNHKDRKPSYKSKRLNLDRATSLIAEIYAVSHALNHLGKRSKVLVHSDCSVLCNAIAEHALGTKIKKSKNGLKSAWEALDKSIGRHVDVSVQFTQCPPTPEGPHPFMLVAHNLAQAGATMPFNKHASKNPADGEKKEKSNRNKRRPRQKRVELGEAMVSEETALLFEK